MREAATGNLVRGLLNNTVWVREYGGVDVMTNADILSEPIEISAFFTSKVTLVRDAQGQERASNILLVTTHPICAGDYISTDASMPDNKTYRVITGEPCHDIDGSIDHYESRM